MRNVMLKLQYSCDTLLHLVPWIVFISMMVVLLKMVPSYKPMTTSFFTFFIWHHDNIYYHHVLLLSTSFSSATTTFIRDIRLSSFKKKIIINIKTVNGIFQNCLHSTAPRTQNSQRSSSLNLFCFRLIAKERLTSS